MIYLVIGTQNSGKSELAEKQAMETGDISRIYLATMKVYDEAGRERVEKHRRQREGKGFVTIEQEMNILEAVEKIEQPEKSTVLLECVSNLVGNELYENPVWKESLLNNLDDIESLELNKQKERFADSIAGDIKKLAGCVNNFIIVTNEYETDGEGYDASTRLYVLLLNMVNERITEFSDEIYDLRKER
jgi:adenosylcobinamide kinase/adenosylcobinamide-phosphate guanylyltransferase